MLQNLWNKKIRAWLILHLVGGIVLFVFVGFTSLPKDVKVTKVKSSIQTEQEATVDSKKTNSALKKIHKVALTKPHSDLGLTKSDIKSVEADLNQPNYLERIYQDRPYANDSGSVYNAKMHFENDLDNPFRFETRHDYERIRDSRREELRNWSKGAMREQTQEVVSNADIDSTPIRIMRSLKGLFGGGDLFNKDKKSKNRTQDKNRGIVAKSDAAHGASEAEISRIYLEENDRTEEEALELRLRSKLNLASRTGQINFQNPLFNTSAQVTVKKGSDRLELNAQREIKPLALSSGVVYGVDRKTLAMNLNKKLTDQLSCELRSIKSQQKEVVSEQSFRFNYNLAF